MQKNVYASLSVSPIHLETKIIEDRYSREYNLLPRLHVRSYVSTSYVLLSDTGIVYPSPRSAGRQTLSEVFAASEDWMI
jgi:hypothetical protein